MKIEKYKYIEALKYFLIFLMPFLISCSSWNVPAKYCGDWISEKSLVTVRTSPKFMKFNFISDSASFILKINDDKTVSGKIGSAEFISGKMHKNFGSGIDYTIECGIIGKIYDKDPLEKKKVEIWLLTMKSIDSLEAELRYTEHGAVFPMAGIMFKRLKK